MITAAIIGIILLYILSGAYKGFLWSVYVLGASIISCALAFALMGPVSSAIRNNEYIYNSMLSYTEGAESIYDVELRKVPIDAMPDNGMPQCRRMSLRRSWSDPISYSPCETAFIRISPSKGSNPKAS